jgi:uncharacterized OB-fold protein
MTVSKPLTPPGARTALGTAHTKASCGGELVLQCCGQCAQVQYPHREVCKHCLSTELDWQVVSTGGAVCASSLLQHSLEPFFKEQGAWLMGSIKLDCGPVVLAHLLNECQQLNECKQANTRVKVINLLDASQQSVLLALPENASADQTTTLQDRLTNELTRG